MKNVFKTRLNKRMTEYSKRELNRTPGYRERVFHSFYPVPLRYLFSLKYRFKREEFYFQWVKAIDALSPLLQVIKTFNRFEPWFKLAFEEETLDKATKSVVDNRIILPPEVMEKLTQVVTSKQQSLLPFNWEIKLLLLLKHPQVRHDDYELLVLFLLLDNSTENLDKLIEMPRDSLYRMLKEQAF